MRTILYFTCVKYSYRHHLLFRWIGAAEGLLQDATSGVYKGSVTVARCDSSTAQVSALAAIDQGQPSLQGLVDCGSFLATAVGQGIAGSLMPTRTALSAITAQFPVVNTITFCAADCLESPGA